MNQTLVSQARQEIEWQLKRYENPAARQDARLKFAKLCYTHPELAKQLFKPGMCGFQSLAETLKVSGGRFNRFE